MSNPLLALVPPVPFPPILDVESEDAAGATAVAEGIEQVSRRALRVPIVRLHVSAGPIGRRELELGEDAPAAPLLSALCRAVAEAGAPLLLADLAADPGPLPRPGGRWPTFRSAIGVPLCAQGGAVLGSLCALDSGSREWSPDDVEVLERLAALAVHDITLSREAAERRSLENMFRMLEKAVENMQLGVTVTDLDGRIIYSNPAEAQMHGYQVGELIGRHARILGPPEHTRSLDVERMQEATSWTRETVNVRRDGTRFPVLLWSDLVTSADGECLGIVTCSEDITERKRAEQSLRDIALRDPLTGLPNRMYFLERLNHAINLAKRIETFQFAVLFLDLDRFKVVNDSLGHHVGDELLMVVAQRLRTCLRPTDTVARFGGDEFAVLLEEIAGVHDATRVAERIQAELAAPIQLNGYELFTCASIGIAIGNAASDQPEYLWRSADMAMYRAKAEGTGRFEVFDRAMHAEALNRLQLETDLRKGLEREEFCLHYQPVVELATERLVGFEALLRWNHPTRGMVYPAEMIPAAEETGLILGVGDWVLREAARQLSAWREQYGDIAPLWVSVNLSSKQLTHSRLVEQIEALVEESGLDPGTLKLEITESAIVENTEMASETLRRLKALGVQLYMDDFGTGYSSLSYLHRLPLDALKIDRSFVSEMERGGKHAQLVHTILSLARSVKLRVVAEGVSTPEQLGLLRDLGCEFGQGFLFSSALPADQVEPLLRERLRGS